MEARPGERTTARRSTEASRAIRGLINKIYARAHEARERGEKVAWVMYGVGVTPILNAMDIAALYPEQYGGFCAAMRKSVEYMEKAESDGYASFLCSYMRNAFGFASMRQELGMMPPDSPERGLADPDFAVGRGPGCDAGRKMVQCVARYYDVPIYNYDLASPPIGSDLKEAKERYIKYQVVQLRGLVEFLEKQTGKKMEWDRLRAKMRLAHETHKIWHEVFELRKAIPCPMPSQDNLSSMVPHWFMPGEQSSLDYYAMLRDEVKGRVENGVGSIPNEKYRLIFSGTPPPWHSMNIFNYFESHGAVFVMDLPYYPGEPVEVEEVPDPLELIALRSWQQALNLHETGQKACPDPRAQRLLDFIGDYRADGLVHHVALSCRATAVGQIQETRMISKYVNIPTLYLQSDMADWRTFSEVDTKMRIDAFMETLAAVKKSSG